MITTAAEAEKGSNWGWCLGRSRGKGHGDACGVRPGWPPAGDVGEHTCSGARLSVAWAVLVTHSGPWDLPNIPGGSERVRWEQSCQGPVTPAENDKVTQGTSVLCE